MTRDDSDLDAVRVRLADGSLRGAALHALIAAQPAESCDAWVERVLGIRDLDARKPSPDRELIGYQPSGVGALLGLIRDVPIGAHDVFVDIGAGLGKATMLVRLLTGASAIGLELDHELCERARAAAAALRLDRVSYLQGDAREQIPQGSVYFMYAPVTGGALASALTQLERALATRTSSSANRVVCTLGLDLAHVPWLHERPSDDLFTSIYDVR